MKYGLDKKAKALVDAALTTDRQAAQKHDVSRQSIYRWRQELEHDTELQQVVTQYWEQVRAADSWVQDATHTIRKAQGFIRDAADELDPSDPAAVEAMTGALNTLAEALQMARIVDARLRTHRPENEQARQDGPKRLGP